MQVLILLAIIGVVLALPRNTQRIVGGEPTTIKRYPYLVNMEYGYKGVFAQSCTGSLLHKHYVLSAAHCYYNGDLPVEWQARLGSDKLEGGGVVHSVSKLIVHGNFDIYIGNYDVSLVRLTNPAIMNKETIGTARIPSPTYIVHDNIAVTAIGYGRISSNGPKPETLQRVDIRTINQDICAERYAYLQTFPEYFVYNVTDDMLCAGALDVGGKDTCQGDSGGPLVQAETIVIGITSWGQECANKTYPGVYTRVSSYTRWIINHAV